MQTITLVTGNPSKLRELLAIAPRELNFTSRALDLPEIQSLDPYEIVKDKLARAYEAVKSPVIVEDVAAGLDDLGGLPGPFFKFFEKQLGREALFVLANREPGSAVTVRCVAGYFDGNDMLFGEGVVHGKVVAPRGENGFGFDPVIIPEGEKRTMAEMPPDKKNHISHRRQAFDNLITQLVPSLKK